MKTITKLFALTLLSIAMLFNQNAFAQYPIKGAPLWGVAGGVDEGLLQPLDQQTSPIWFKVNGNIVGQQPHNKLHNPGNTAKGGSYASAGALVDVNFNVNKNIANRYSLVSYTVAADGTRNIFDYQSNIYNQSAPVQGNSNQQMVLVPTNCPWEVYFVKGAVVTTFMASGPQDLINGPGGNPYAYKADGVTLRASDPNSVGGNLVLGFTFGDGAAGAVCESCPAIGGTPNDYVHTRLLEVIDLPNGEKEMLFHVINTNGTTTAPYMIGTKTFPLVGDILFSGITPTHTKNNTPYQMRSDYQLSPVLPGYTVGTVPYAFGPKDAFVFDQRNNHHILAFDTYQSEVVRFKVTDAEFLRLSTAGATPVPEICVELSPKHPEPHKTLVPIFCAPIDFDCEPTECPTTGNNCERTDCAFTYVLDLRASAPELVGLSIFNDTGTELGSIRFTLPLMTAAEMTALEASASGTGDGTWTAAVTSDATNTYLTFTQVGTAFNALGSIVDFAFTVPLAYLNSVGGMIPAQLATGVGTINQTFNVQDPACINPLPVELTTFTGSSVAEGVALKWKTASEKDNERFEIERSVDGKNFEKIGSMQGKGTTSSASSYQFIDKAPLKGINYYRLNQVDFDGTNAHSKVIKVNSENRFAGLGVRLIPNPCPDQNCSIELQGVDATKALTVEMRDLTGRIVFSQQIPADQSSFNLPKAGISKGIYILSARNGENITNQKVIIQ